MDIKNFLSKVCNEIKYEPVKESISEELNTHIQDIKENYISNGLNEKHAEEKAVAQMGEAEEIGKKLNKIHRPKLDWKLIILIGILLGFGLCISVLKQPMTSNSHVRNTIIYIFIGVIIGTGIYFFDYRKIKKYSNIIYIISSILLLLPHTSLGLTINGVSSYIRIFNITIMPCHIAVPLYIIAFIGFIVDYDKNKQKKMDIKLNINKDLAKITILSILSLILIIQIPSVANASILELSYLIIGTIKIIKTDEEKIKKLVIIYGFISVIAIAFIVYLIATSYSFRLNRIISSFKPEIDPNGSGYIGMLQKEVLENAKLIGEAETEIISSDGYIICKENTFAFIYLLGKTGIINSGLLVLTIILTATKLIHSAKDVKEIYGKLLIIGLGSLIILQSIANVLMNINLGIKADVNLPFVTYGGTYLIINIISIALILAVYRRKDINLDNENETNVRENFI